VPNFGHSAKTCFAERHTQQNMALGKEAFAECLALGKDLHSAKADTRQRLVGLNGIQRRPLCRVPPVWHSAKNLFCRVPKLGTQQNIFFVFCHQFFEALVHYHKQHV